MANNGINFSLSLSIMVTVSRLGLSGKAKAVDVTSEMDSSKVSSPSTKPSFKTNTETLALAPLTEPTAKVTMNGAAWLKSLPPTVKYGYKTMS